MQESKNLGLAASFDDINFYVLCSNENVDRPYGIMASTETDKEDLGVAENLFFTKEEAVKCCLWLAENQVFPITLCEVMENFYH